ncbi:MAG: hypothetical protein MUF51_03945 [Vicinamibacteria bacterium]|nr:hypothetical protein [Vicinamibacteria bacterium]
MLTRARGGQAADEGQPEREMFDIGRGAGEVPATQRTADRVAEREQDEQGQGGSQQALLEAAHDTRDLHRLLLGGVRRRYSSR